MAGLALVSSYNFSMPWKQIIGLINCFRIAKVTPEANKVMIRAKINIVLGEIEKFLKQKKSKPIKGI
jgi:hypothetical protein